MWLSSSIRKKLIVGAHIFVAASNSSKGDKAGVFPFQCYLAFLELCHFDNENE